MIDFIGVKIALLKGSEVLVIQRDNHPGLRFAGMWDFPGGGREGNESPFECIARETEEELGLALNPESIIWEKTYPAMHDPSLTAYFMVANIDDTDIRGIILGDEGQGWKMISIDAFMIDDTVIELLKGRLKDYLDSTTPSTYRG